MKAKAPFFAASYDTFKKSLFRFLILSFFCFSSTQSYAANTNNFQLLHSFGPAAQGENPHDSLILDSGVLYGMTPAGGSGNGTIFSCNADGSNYQIVRDFDGTGGATPLGSFILDSGVLYGMTSAGGANSNGIIFSCNTDGSNFLDLHDFDVTDGTAPQGSLILDKGVLYGMTSAGGSGTGTIFSCNKDGSNYQILHTFSGTDGAFPFGSLILNKGVLYGMTSEGGAHADGIIFSCNTDGSNFQDLHDFAGPTTDGANPLGSLLLDSGVLYGMTSIGGAHSLGTIFYLLNPVSNLTGHQLKNDFGILFERFNKLNWQAYSFPSSAVQGYNVYRNGVKIATLSNITFTYDDHNIKKGVTTSYSVTSFDAFGNESVPVTVTIK
jgi:uncharacterized repeat protein (TIGR03803 family)